MSGSSQEGAGAGGAGGGTACASHPGPGRSKLLVLDFDGTMTDAEEEGAPYRQGYLEDLASLCGVPFKEVNDMASQVQKLVAVHPNDNGWDVGGRIVAPAGVDPYIRMKPIAHRIMDRLGVFMNADDRSRVLEILYKYNYQKTLTFFRHGAKSCLERLRGTNTFVVTNSYGEMVKRKLKSLGENGESSSSLDWMMTRVHGLARKYILADGFEAVPETLTVPGLSRPVYLRREQYFRVLEALLKEAGCDWQDLVVVGDIFELDLALPFAMGARVGLLANEFTPPYEREFLEKSERGCVLETVEQIPDFAFGLQPEADGGGGDGTARPAKVARTG